MTQEQAEKAANVVIGLAAVGAAYLILSNPSLRRGAWRIARAALTSTGPGWLLVEARRAWDRSGADEVRSTPTRAAVRASGL